MIDNGIVGERITLSLRHVVPLVGCIGIEEFAVPDEGAARTLCIACSSEGIGERVTVVGYEGVLMHIINE